MTARAASGSTQTFYSAAGVSFPSQHVTPCQLAHLLFFFQAEDGIRDDLVTGVQTCALPIFKATILTPDEYLGSVIKLCQDRRGAQRELSYVGSRALVVYDLPLNEVVFDF